MPELRPGMMHKQETPDLNHEHKLKKAVIKIMTLFTPIKSHLKPQEKPPEDRNGQEMARVKGNIHVIGVCQPEKFAEGMCPSCKSMIELWLLPQGIEIALPEQGYDAEAPSK